MTANVIPLFGFARGAVVTHVEVGGNWLVMRTLETTTVVLAIELEEGGAVHLREYPTRSLRQRLPADIAQPGPDAVTPHRAPP